MMYNDEQLEIIEEYIQRFDVLRHMPVRIAYDNIVMAVNKYIAEDAYKSKISCGSVKNCSMCCHDDIPMGLVEGDIIKQYVKDNNIQVNRERVLLQNSGEKITWMQQACPLLSDEDENGNRMCSIYDKRPLICRIHNSSSDPILCKRENNKHENTTIEVLIMQAHALNFISYVLGTNSNNPQLTFMHEILK